MKYSRAVLWVLKLAPITIPGSRGESASGHGRDEGTHYTTVEPDTTEKVGHWLPTHTQWLKIKGQARIKGSKAEAVLCLSIHKLVVTLVNGVVFC